MAVFSLKPKVERGLLRSLTCFLNVCYKQGTPTEYLMVDNNK